MPRQFDVVIERDEEGYYIASAPQLPGFHTQARPLDEVTARIREAIELCLEIEDAEAALKTPNAIPERTPESRFRSCPRRRNYIRILQTAFLQRRSAQPSPWCRLWPRLDSPS